MCMLCVCCVSPHAQKIRCCTDTQTRAHTRPQVWVKPSAEMQFLYGNHVLKSGLGRITEGTPAYAGVIVYSIADVPLGFGVAAKGTGECRSMDPSGIVVFHQADCGEYLRAEDEL